MVNNFIRNNTWDSEYRPEQMRARDIILELHPDWKLKLEYVIRNLTLDGTPYKMAKPDIAVTSHNIVIRLNGERHFTSEKQRIHDEFQYEALKQAGWTVIEFDKHMMPNLFAKKRTIEKDILAKEEIIKYLGKATTNL